MDPRRSTINHDVVKSNQDNDSPKVTKVREMSPLPSGSNDQDEKRKTSSQSKNYSSPPHDRKRNYRSDNGSSRYRHSGREYRSPDRRRHSRSERDRSRTPDRHHYNRSRHRQSNRHQDYHHRRDRRRSHSTSPTRRSGHSGNQYKRDNNNARRMSSGGEQTAYRDNSKSERNKPLESSAQTNQSSSSGITSKPGKSYTLFYIFL